MGVDRKTQEKPNAWQIKRNLHTGKPLSPHKQAGEPALEKIEENVVLQLPAGLDFPPGLPVVASKIATEQVQEQHQDEAADDADDDASPPGTRPPPGLEESELRTVGRTVSHVFINGLPKKLLNEVMMEAVIEQAGLGTEVTGFTVQKSGGRDGSSREVVVGFSCCQAAQRCVAHFDGCQFGNNGVTCRMVSGAVEDVEVEKPVVKLSDAELALQHWWETCGQAAWAADQEALLLQAASRFVLSAEAPAFVPAGICTSDASDCKDTSGIRKISDASTDVGSEMSDDTADAFLLDGSPEGLDAVSPIVAAC